MDFKRIYYLVFIFHLAFYSGIIAQDIHSSIASGNLEKVKAILEKNPSLLDQDNGNGTPLYQAVRSKRMEIIQYLIDKGADVNKKTSNGMSPALYAAYHDECRIVELLLLNGAEIGIHEAAACGFKGILLQQLARGIDVNKPAPNGAIPIKFAVRQGDEDMTELLVRHGANYNFQDSYCNLLHWAVTTGGNIKLVEYLVSLGVDMNEKMKFWGDTPLDLAMFGFGDSEGNKDIAELLLKHGAESTSISPAETKKFSEKLMMITIPYTSNPTNNAVFIGNEGVLIVDTGYRRTGKELYDTIKNITPKRIKYIINTHNHRDHIEGNFYFQDQENTSIISLDNLKQYNQNGLVSLGKGPLEGNRGHSFESYYTMSFNGEEIRLIPYLGLHSSSDMLVQFVQSGIVCTGDIFSAWFKQGHDETEDDYTERIKKIIIEKRTKYFALIEKMIDIFPENTTFIPGHRSIFTMEDVVKYAEFIKALRNKINN